MRECYTAGVKTAYLLAYPAGHSVSPAMHNAAFEALGLEARYEALERPPEALAAAVDGLRHEHAYGANVTIPHKQAVMPLMDTLSEAARTIGAVNTIINQGGTLLGHNTDASGFLRALRDDAGFDPSGRHTLMLGAGGSARAVAYALLSAGVKTLRVYNRTHAKAAALAKSFAQLGDIKAISQEELATHAEQVTLLVNTTSVGMTKGGKDPDTSPLEAALLPRAGLVCDIIYRPAKTRLLKDAQRAGLNVLNGLPMLVYQGAESFQAWTGQGAPAQVMRRAAEAAL